MPKVAWKLKLHAFVLAAILVLLPVHAFVSTWGGTTIGPLLFWKSWKEILLALLLPFSIWLLLERKDIARSLWRSPLNRWILVYFALNILMALVSQASPEAVVAGLLMNLRFLAVFLVAEIVFYGVGKSLEKLKPLVAPWLLWTTIVVSLLAILQVFVLPKDFLTSFGYNKDLTIAPYVLVDENQNAVRAFSTLRGPNTLGAYLVLPLMAAVVLLVGKKSYLGVAALVLGTTALALTVSRSAWIGVGAGLVALASLLLPWQQLKRWLKIGIIPALLVVAASLALAVTVPAVRLVLFHSSPGDESLIEGSTQKHFQSTWDGVRDILDNPFGGGVGTAGPASFYNINPGGADVAENYYVQIGQELGIAGLVLFVAICWQVAKRLWMARDRFWPRVLLAGFLGLTVINLLLHGWADDPTAMTWWALAGLYLNDRKG